MSSRRQRELCERTLERIPAASIADLLRAIGNLPSLCASELRLVMDLLGAERGCGFWGIFRVTAAGYPLDEARQLGRRLFDSVVAGRVTAYSQPRFAARLTADEPAVGLALALEGCPADVVLAVERDRPFRPQARAELESLCDLLQRPVDLTVQLRPRHERALKTAIGLQLGQVHPLPQFREVELILLEEALRRAHTRAEAAAVLGVTREGLRRKMLRLGLTTLLRQPRRARVRAI